MESIPDYGDVMTIEEFKSAVDCGAFIDYDGFGNYANLEKNQMNGDHNVYPSSVKKGEVAPQWATHIVWFNR